MNDDPQVFLDCCATIGEADGCESRKLCMDESSIEVMKSVRVVEYQQL